MPNLFGQEMSSVEDMTAAFRRYGDAMRLTYRARYVHDSSSTNVYAGTKLERPEAMAKNPPDLIYPWEQVFIAAAGCAGSDYPMLSGHLGVPISRVEFVVEGVFDPRGEFSGLAGFEVPHAPRCYFSLHLRATLTSPAPKEKLEALHRRAIDHNMVLDALRGIPRTDELTVVAP